MGRVVMVGILCLAAFVLSLRPLSAQEAKGLGPGWLSLDSSVGLLDKQIQDGKSALENVLGIQISGFLDTSYTWSSNHPGSGNNNDISLRVFDIDYNDIVFNHFNLTLERPEPEGGWGIGGKVVADFGRTAELLREATRWNAKFQTQPSAELREAYLTTTLPVGNGLQIKGGLFVTLLGTEIIPNPGAYNDNISRSYLFGFAIPFRHLGVLLSYPLHKTLTLTAGPVTGWDNPHDTNSVPSLLGGITFTPTETFSLNSSVVFGAEQDGTSGPKRVAWANVATFTPTDSLSIGLEYTYGFEQNATASLRNATWQGVGTIISYNWTDRFSTAVRGEFFHDHDGVRLGGEPLGTRADVKVGEFTLTGAYKFTSQLLGRLELRQDFANGDVFFKGSSSADRNQTTLALQGIYTF